MEKFIQNLEKTFKDLGFKASLTATYLWNLSQHLSGEIDIREKAKDEISPVPECRGNSKEMFERFKQEIAGNYTITVKKMNEESGTVILSVTTDKSKYRLTFHRVTAKIANAPENSNKIDIVETVIMDNTPSCYTAYPTGSFTDYERFFTNGVSYRTPV